MKNLIHSIKDFFYKNKLLFVLSVGGGFLLFLVLLITQNVPSASKKTMQPTPILNPVLSPNSATPQGTKLLSGAVDDDSDLSFLSSAQNKEALSDGTTKYAFPSSNPQRPNQTITKNQIVVFQRSIIPSSQSLQLSSFKNLYGSTRWIFKGSKFYGQDINTYVYADIGLVLIVNTQTGTVLEEQFFQPMLIGDYIKTYGEDIQSPTPEP